MATFAELGLNPAILKAIEAAGYTEPTEVQIQAVPAAIAGADLMVSSHTGSGKTAAFMLPALQRLASPPQQRGKGARILVLTPTRELALQVQKAAETYGSELGRLRTVCLVGGMPYPEQIRQLGAPVDVIVATPGRLIDHMTRGRIAYDRLEMLVLDEADRMLDMGFIEDIETIVAATPANRQTMLFSATLDGTIGTLARKLTRNPQRIEVATPAARENRIDQRMLFADNMTHKVKLLDVLLRDPELKQSLVFTSTKRAAEDLSISLRSQGFAADALHGDMGQGQRNFAIRRMREGRTRILVATDVAARGIDVVGITHVINFDAPRQAEDYVHRIGRTGRAGRTGVAVTLLTQAERGLMKSIERFTGQTVRVDVIVGLEPTARPWPSQQPKGGRGRPGGGGGGYGKPRTGAGRPGGAPTGRPAGGPGAGSFAARRAPAAPGAARPQREGGFRARKSFDA